jgi:hypothetical protein
MLCNYWYSCKGIAQFYPHKFHPCFPIPSMALSAALTEIVVFLNFDPITGIYNTVMLNNKHQKHCYNKWFDTLIDMTRNEYHDYFLDITQEDITKTGM